MVFSVSVWRLPREGSVTSTATECCSGDGVHLLLLAAAAAVGGAVHDVSLLLVRVVDCNAALYVPTFSVLRRHGHLAGQVSDTSGGTTLSAGSCRNIRAEPSSLLIIEWLLMVGREAGPGPV